MIIDFSQTEETIFNTDICIIGTGAAGFASAISLLHSNLNVIIVEGGGDAVNEQAQNLHMAEVTGHPHDGIHSARERIVGGTTTKWGGQALPFMSADFIPREHVPLSGWPVSFEEMAPYYRRAEDILGTDGNVLFSYNPWAERNITLPAFTISKMELIVTKWCKVPNFSTQYRKTLEENSNITLLINANVVELLPTPQRDSVNELKIVTLNNKHGYIRAKFVIAAGGALETVRLFLASTKFGSTGAGNASGFVGCYFQDHVASTVGEIIPASRKKFHNIFDTFYKSGFKYLPRIKINPVEAQKKQTLHSSAQIIFTEKNDGSLEDAKKILHELRNKRMPTPKSLREFLKLSKIKSVGNAIWRWKIGQRGSSNVKGPVWLEVHSEQNPVFDSRISLAKSCDKLGMPRISLHWVISDLTIKTIRLTAKLVKEEFERTNVGRVVLKPWIEDETIDSFTFLSDVYHQAGGLRMSDNEHEGVVDKQCKVNGIDNLYVASSAVFPTSSFSNPTMTIIALAIRISNTIEQLINRPK